MLAIKWYRKVIHALNTNYELLNSLNNIYRTNFKMCLIKIQQYSESSETERIKKNYTSKPIVFNTDNYPKFYVSTSKKNTNFQHNSFTIEHYNIELTNNNNQLEININLHIQQIINRTSTPSNTDHTNSTFSRIAPFRCDQITDEFLQHFEYNAKAEALFIIQQYLMDEDNLVFFTDENWPSSLRAELFAILLTLIISPHECRIDINMDSQNSINIIQRILNNPTFSIRDYFHLSNNNVIINNIISIIRVQQLCVKFIKVQAHSDNYFNNQIDKYKLLSEQLTVLEKTKRQYYEIYQNSTCVLCSEKKETFVHIWLCLYQDEAYFKLYNQFKNTLLYSILDVKPNEIIIQLNHDFENFHLTRSLHSTLFTFLDIIKGYVPSFLVEWLQ
ncbi:ribonuclease H-like domain-containing protein [Rhizophagus clarus]|uniref:Ribonuclease H-like domain-containing protein n=1 Tax=Rhizophagus clarus TaxID=94130 RepID=A0A8H3R2W1_9GLOM|nr:ribonuclease H-like domain-containing protein [Rhizophagus clarus]